MILAILLAAGLAWWLHKEGVLLPNLKRLAVLGGGGVLIARLLETGQVLFAAAAGVALAGWWFASKRKPPAPAPTELAEARAVLGVAPSDDAAAINAAWRRVIAQVHPDKGGTADLARRVTAARDLLLARR
jgi:DnaJ family protein C protein 19